MVVILGRLFVKIPASTMDSYTKETHKYAFELVKAVRKMAVDLAEKLPHIKEIRNQCQEEALKVRIDKRIN